MTATAEFYDRALTAPDAPSMLPLDQSPWRALYQEAAHWVPANADVVDLGCGTGTFFDALYRAEHYGHRAGVDFANEALDVARRANGTLGVFEHADLTCWQPDPHRAGGTVYTCLEVLEHLADDLDLVGRVPPGHELIFSVPNYESESHVRHFRHVSHIWRRYAGLLRFRRWSLIELDDRKAIHLVDAVRRVESW